MIRILSSAYGYFLWAIVALVLAFSHAPVFSDPDTAWHLAAGDLIRSLHHIPYEDDWSFTAQGECWYNLSWLYDVTISLLFQYTGFSGLFALTLFIFASAVTLMATHCISRGASFILVGLYAIIITVPIIHVVLLARPAMLSLLFTVGMYRLLWGMRACYIPSRQSSFEVKKLGIAILIIMALWVNVHGGFLLGPVLIGLFLAEAIFQHDHKRIQCFGIVLTLSLFATLCNPYGFSVYYGAYRTLTSAYNATLVEWQPTGIGRDGPMTLVFLLVLWLSNAQDKKITLIDRMLMPFIFTMAMNALRHSAAATLLAMPYFTLRATSLLEKGRISTWILSRDAAISRDMRQYDIRIMSLIVASIAALLIALPFPRDMVLKKPLGFSEENFPKEEASYVAAHYPTLRFITDYNIGGYLDYLWHGQPKVFVDGRANSLYSEDLLQDYHDFINSNGFGARADMIVRYYHIDGVIVSHDTEIAGHWRDNPEWKAVFRGKAASVYLRK